MLEKLKSRKFLAALAGVIVGVCMAFGLDENVVSVVAGAVTAVASVITYIVTEGKVDAAAVAEAIEKVQDAESVISDDNKPAVD